MLKGSCHCGLVEWTCDHIPDAATACSCTACRRYGGLWAYGWEGEDIRVSGATKTYVWGDKMLARHFCAECHCLAYWRILEPNAEGRWRMAVNLRLCEPGPVADVPIRHFDGLDRWEDLPQDGRCVKDLWF